MQQPQDEAFQRNADQEGNDTSDMSRLFAAVISEQTAGMDEAQAAAYLAEVLDGGVETDHLFDRLVADSGDQLFLATGGHHPDTAVREASLAPRNQWQENQGGELAYQASNAL